MKSFLSHFLASFLAVIVFLGLVAVAVLIVTGQEDKIEDNSWLLVNVTGQVLEYDPPSDPMSALTGGNPETLTRILGNLEKASHDERIEGVLLTVRSSSLGLAGTEEVRAAIKNVQATGREVIGYTDNIGHIGYLLLAACDRIIMPPSAYIQMTGLATTSMHARGLLDKLGVKPNIHKIKDYKAAAEMMMRTDMSDAARENGKWLIDEYWDIAMTVMREDRGLSEEQVLAMMELANFSTQEALEGGLVDEIMYLDQLEEKLCIDKDEDLPTVSMYRYADVEPKKVGLKGKKKIAVIHAQGMIAGRTSGVNPLLGVTMGSDTVVGDLRAAREDDDILAIIFRVDSGGGDALVSDLIGHEIANCAAAKPTIVSMVNVAASGGYHIAYRATKIIASEGSIVGSIGSISGKFNNKELMNKLGINFDHETKGPNALMWSSDRNFTEAEWERFKTDHWRGFNEWLADVAEHRGMTFEEAEKLAHGRVFTGRQSLANGLIDELGGYDRAVELAKELAEIPADEYVQQLHYPECSDFVSSLLAGDLVYAGQRTAEWRIYEYLHEDLIENWEMVIRQYLIGESIPDLR
jgi:protease IV